MCPVLTDERPAHTAIAGHGSGAVDCLDRTDRAGIVLNKITTVRRDGKSAASIENDVDDVVGDVRTRQKGGHEVGIEVCAGEMRVKSRRELAMDV